MNQKIVLGNMIFGWKVPLIHAIDITDKAVENGISIIDTSPSYGNGLSVIICGFLIQKYPNIRISTKFAIPHGTSINQIQNSILNSCNESLKRLRTECLHI